MNLQDKILEALRQYGPMNVKAIGNITGGCDSDVTKALKRMNGKEVKRDKDIWSIK